MIVTVIAFSEVGQYCVGDNMSNYQNTLMCRIFFFIFKYVTCFNYTNLPIINYMHNIMQFPFNDIVTSSEVDDV